MARLSLTLATLVALVSPMAIASRTLGLDPVAMQALSHAIRAIGRTVGL